MEVGFLKEGRFAMNRLKLMVAGAVMMVAGSSAMAHFVFVVPDKEGKQANVMMSEDLEIDKEVGAKFASDAKLTVRGADGKDVPAALGKEHAHHYEMAIAGSGDRVIYGTVDRGVKQGKTGPAYQFTYYPKAIIGDAFGAKATVGESLPVELVPMGKPGEVKFQLLAEGKPVVNGEVHVILPGAEGEKKVTTDANGETPAFKETGRFGAWGKTVTAKAGEVDGKKYEEVRRYPTLVVDIGGGK
jgi:uncharacterized GH25 family protein